MTEHQTAVRPPTLTTRRVATAQGPQVRAGQDVGVGARVRARRVRAAEVRLTRLRFYSYCLTLLTCVSALMAFMYLTQGAADGDPLFLEFGAMFVTITGAGGWGAVRMTRVR